MEPFLPEFRRALKEAHPGLNDGDIDRLQELTARRQSIAAERDAQTRLNLDHQIEELLREKLPQFDRVSREYAAMRHAESAARTSSKDKVEVRFKRERY